jgi:hypothetical protein
MARYQDALKAYEERKKKEEEDKQSSFSSKRDKINSAVSKYEERQKSGAKDAISSLAKSINDEISKAQKLSAPTWGDSAMGDALSSTRESRVNIESLQRRLEAYKSHIDEKEYSNMFDALKSMQDAYDSYLSMAEGRAEYKSESDYLKKVQQAKKSEEEYNKKLNFNLEEGQREIDALQKDLDAINAVERQISEIHQNNQVLKLAAAKGDRNSATKLAENEKRLALLNNALNDAAQKYGGKDQLSATISEKQRYYTLASRAQKGVELSSVVSNGDFKANSQYKSTAFTPDNVWEKLFHSTEYDLGYDDLTHQYINGDDEFRAEVHRQHANYSKDSAYDDGESRFEKANYDEMTEDEVNIYNYYYNTEGKEKAQEYLDSIQETLNLREAQKVYSGLEGKVFQEMLFGVAAGLDQFASGLGNLFSNEDYIPPSSTQIASGMVREDLADNGAKLPEWMGGSSVGQLGYDMVTTTFNMLPSILVSSVAGPVAGAALLGASASGNAYAEMLNLGYSKDQARSYGLLVGASETALQYALGGIGKLGGKLSGNAIANFVSKFDNAIARTAIKLGGNMLSEGLEESIQAVLEPWFKSIATGEEFEGIAWDEVIYSGLMGALSAGILEGGSTIMGEVSTYQQGKALKETGTESVDRLVSLGQTFSADSVAYQLAGKVNENTGAYTIGRLLNEVGASLSEQNKTDIANALVEKGMTEADAKTISKWLGKAVDGGYFTKGQIATLESNEVISSVFQDVIINQNSTVNQRIQGYNDALHTLADEMSRGKTTEANAKTEEAQQTASEPTAMLSNEEFVRRVAEATGLDATAVARDFAQQAETSPVTENAPTEQIATEGEFEASQRGKAKIGDTEVSIKEIASVKDGEIILRLEDDSTVNANDVEYGSSAEALIYENVADMNLNAATANAFVKGYDPSEGLSAQEYVLGFREAYRYGEYGFPVQEMSKNGFSAKLSQTQRSLAYDLGKTDMKYKVSAQQAKIASTGAINSEKNASMGAKNGKVHYAEGISTKRMTQRQKASIKGLERLAYALGVEFHIFESEVGENGKRKGANGWFDPKDGSIHIDLHAGLKGEGTILFTASHELTHFIREWSPEKFKVFADFLLEQYGQKGISVDALVRNQIAKAKRNGRDIDFDTAYEEVIADSCESMLADGEIMQKLAELKAKDKTLWEKIKSFIADLVAKIKAAYAGLSPDSIEGRYVAEMLDAATNLKTLFTDALVDAGESYSEIREALGDGSVIEVNENGEFTVGKTADGDLLFNDRTYDEGGRETLRATLEAEGYSDADIDAALAIIDGKHELVKRFGEVYKQQDIVNKATLTTDLKNGNAVLSAIVSNGDYPVNIDLSMVCKKRVAYQNVINRLCQSGLINQATIDSLAIAEINKVLGKYGFETACLGCFVESRRIRIQEWAQTICKEWNGIVDKMVGKGNAKAFGFAKETFVKDLSNAEVNALSTELDSAYERDGLHYGRTTVVKKMEQLLREVPSLRKHLSVADLITPTGRTHIKSLSSELNSLIACRYGSNTPKIVQDFNPYNHELAQYGKVPKGYNTLRDYLYAIGGARMQSFSDFIVENWFDYCQIVADLSARKLPMHTYTKEISLAKLFGMTGIKVNMSLIPDIDRSLGKEYAGLTKNAKGEYELIFADKDRFKATGGKSYMQSINFADAVALQQDPRYSSNVGTIAVGISDNHIRMMLGDSRIRMVIPYHSSGMNPIFAHLVGTDYYKDYTTFQNTGVAYLIDSKGNKRNIKLSKTATTNLTSGFEFNKVLQELGDARAAAQAYLDWCADASKHTITIDKQTYTAVLTPKFSEFADHENYYKLLEDFNTYDSITEQAAPQGDVQQIYPEDFDTILEDEIKSRDNYRKKQEPKWESAMGEIEGYLKSHKKADTIAYAKEHGIKLSKKDMKLSDRDSDHSQAALEEFGTTTDFEMAGFVLADGRMLKLSQYGQKGVQHKRIESVYTDVKGEAAINRFIQEGNVRIKATAPGIEIGSENAVSTRQLNAISRFVSNSLRSKGVFYLDITDANGEEVASIDYDSGVSASDIMYDIKEYYERGRVPRPVRYSDRDTASFNGKPFWSGSVSLLDGVIEEVHTMEEAEAADYHHSMYFSPEQVEKMANEENAFFFVENGVVQGDWRVSVPDSIIEKIKEQIKISPAVVEAREFSDTDLKYSIREEEPPKNTMEGYKVFVVKNGKLYPPMVANPNAEDTPVGVWLNADVGTRAPDSKTGRMQVKAGGKGTQGGSGSLAFRPGWHLGETPLATQFDRLNPETGVKELFPENFVWALCDIAADHDYQEEAMSYGYTKNGKFQHSLAGLPKLPTDGYYKYRTNPNPDTVPWLITGAMKVKKLLSDAEVNAILAEKGLPPKQRVGGDKTLADLGLSQYEGKLFSDRDTDSVSNRSLLANALESVAQNDVERNKLKEYKSKIALIESEQAKLAEVKAQIKELSFAKGKRDTEAIKQLQFEANQSANRINTYDRQLLNLESTKALKGVLEREKKMAYKKAEREGKDALAKYREKAAKTQRELLTRYQESRAKGVEGRRKTEMRHKIRNVVKDLNHLLNHGTKKKNVKEELKETVVSSLKLAEVLLSNDIQNEDIVRLGVESVTEKESALLAEYSNLLDTIEALKEKREYFCGTEKVRETLLAKVGSVEEEIAKAKNKISRLNGQLSDVFARERARLNRATVDQLVADLAAEYLKLKDSESDYIRAAYDEYKYKRLDALKNSIGGTPVSDMSMAQLTELYDAYKMVAHFVRNADKAFKAQRGETITQMAEAVNDQVRTVGGQPYKRNVVSSFLQREMWHLLKPYVAFRTIGSVTLTNLYKNLRAGEDTFYVDVKEATAFIEEQYEKHGYKDWDFKKTETFTAKSGKTFDLTLEQMMTLYAYSKREKAHKHIIEGGIVFEDSMIVEKNKWGVPIKYEVTSKDAFNLSEETFAKIANSLTAEQKAFVDAMQEYLSKTMGAKGNEVSMVLEGVKLFNEEFYLPIKSSQYYMNFSAEEAGEVKLKSPGFSKDTTPGANNPIVLHNFTDLWAEHINDMSMYHSFVLALEDFTRVYNYKTRTDAKVETMDTKATLETAYPGVKNYINKFLKDMNGGVRSETVGWAEKLTSLAKKGAVLGSASVAIQQPSAIMRAMAMINHKHFVATAVKSFNFAKHKQDWEELKKYAPIAGIKEMGRFDVGMGRGTVELIKSQDTALSKIDDILGLGPEIMDEITWVSIWNAVKRETVHNRKDLRPGSEEFLNAAGERVTDVISLTQVYDSVFSRSDIMRNKSLVAKWLTAFMAEPMTTLNMLIDAYVQGKRTGSVKGFAKTAATTGGAVMASIVFNSLLKSIVMAARDDDEDETYVEKYLEHFFGDLKDNINPLTLVPVAKDVLSIFNGYDVERMDMSLVSDFKKAIEAFDNDNKTLYDKWSGLIGATSAFFGIPVKNVERDVRAVINTFFGKKESATKQGLLNAISEGWTGESKSNAQQLYEAMLKGDKAQIERVKGRFDDDKAITSAIRTALRENDTRIHDAAVARYEGDIAEYTRIAREIIAEGYFKQDDVVAAINAEINALKKGEGTTNSTAESNKATSIYKVEDYFTAIVGRDQATAYVVKEDIIKTAMANGKDRDEAEADFNSSFASHLRDEFEAGTISNDEAIDMLVEYGGKTEEAAESKVQYWAFKKQYPDYDLSEEAVTKYYSDVEPSGIDVDVYYDYSKQRSKCKGVDLNGDGKTDSGSVKREVLEVIDSLPITYQQKDVLYYLNGWSASTIWEAPWH